jgi:aspartyl-tRNA(Asn)/glutamyl-tRNA(Gln) amidotransferase subunit A
MSVALTDRSVAELAHALRARETTAVQVLDAHLARITALDARLHGFVTVTAEDARTAARAADAALARGDGGPLTGIPIAVKDLLAVRGVPRGNGSLAFAGAAPSTADAAVVARLRAAGAVIVGTTHMHELAFGPTGVNDALGTPLNPWRAGHVPGGSSSGSGAVVAARCVPAALGSDTGGSIRMPASCCGVAGLKPTWGRVSRHGCTPLGWSLDHVGPIARTVEDLALVLQLIAGPDPADPTSASLPVPNYAAAIARPLKGTRIGVPRDFCLALVDPEVAAAFDTALATLRDAGAVVVDVSLPALEHSGPALGAIILPEACAALRPLLGSRIDQVSIETRIYLELGKVVTAQQYLAAQRLRTRLYEEIQAEFARVDLLAMPTTPLPAPVIGQPTLQIDGRTVGVVEAISRLTAPFNLTGMPALSVPCGFSTLGLPIGLQLAGRPFAEADVLAAGAAYQRLTDWHRRSPAL